MTVSPTKKKKAASGRLRKKFITIHERRAIYSIDASIVRNIAQPDEEFGNFASKDRFPDLIPANEIWIGEKNLDKEGVFFIANALACFKAKENGSSDDKAYAAGIEIERVLREKLTGLKFRDGKPHKHVPPEVYVEPYTTLPDKQSPIEVWLVDGNVVRSLYKTDYTEGGHGYVYRWVPKQEIWVEKDLDGWELPFIVSHEYLELRLMRDEGLDYDHAHNICARVEFDFRKRRGGKPIVSPGRRSMSKRDLPRLTGDEIFDYVRKTYCDK